MTVSGCEGVLARKVGEDYLAFSPVTGETVVLSPLASFILNKVLVQATNDKELFKKVEREFLDVSDIDAILQITLQELSKKGFVYY